MADHLTILEPQHLWTDDLDIVKKRQSTDFQVLNLGNAWSGRTQLNDWTNYRLGYGGKIDYTNIPSNLRMQRRHQIKMFTLFKFEAQFKAPWISAAIYTGICCSSHLFWKAINLCFLMLIWSTFATIGFLSPHSFYIEGPLHRCNRVVSTHRQNRTDIKANRRCGHLWQNKLYRNIECTIQCNSTQNKANFPSVTKKKEIIWDGIEINRPHVAAIANVKYAISFPFSRLWKALGQLSVKGPMYIWLNGSFKLC